MTISEILEEASAIGLRSEVQSTAEGYLNDPTVDPVFVYQSTFEVLIESEWEMPTTLDWDDLIL